MDLNIQILSPESNTSILLLSTSSLANLEEYFSIPMLYSMFANSKLIGGQK